MKIMKEFKEYMIKTFEMTDLILMNYFLSIEVKQQKKVYLSLKINILKLY